MEESLLNPDQRPPLNARHLHFVGVCSARDAPGLLLYAVGLLHAAAVLLLAAAVFLHAAGLLPATADAKLCLRVTRES